ncbi:MAG: sensor histidine kinase [Desulfosudaceae bacterium]
MTRTRWILFLIATFFFSAVTLGLSLFLYIYWYIEVSAGLETLVNKFNLRRVDIAASDTWVVITVLSILVGLILIGFFLIFVYNLKTLQLFRLQRNFINNFTHELKTPVTSLQLYLETFLKHDLDRDERIKYLHSMMADVNRLSSTINSILKLAEVESRTYAGAFAETDLVWAIKQFYKKNHHRFQDAEISLDNLVGEPVRCRINQHLFDMLLMNLFTNAVKYTAADQPRISVTVSRSKNRKKAVVRFADNGIGVDRTHRKKIFKKFYQVGLAETRSARGNGLGLYLAAHIVRLHKGKIFVTENPDEESGSVFVLVLPLAGRRAGK